MLSSSSSFSANSCLMRAFFFAKRCCSDDANLCEAVEVNVGENDQVNDAVNKVLQDNRFFTMFRRQIEKVSAAGTAACYVRLDGADVMDDETVRGGRIRLNYVDAESYMPLTVENDDVIEAAFSGTALRGGKEETTLVIFTKPDSRYQVETHIFDDKGNEIKDRQQTVELGEVKPFAVLRNAEVNNYDGMDGYVEWGAVIGGFGGEGATAAIPGTDAQFAACGGNGGNGGGGAGAPGDSGWNMGTSPTGYPGEGGRGSVGGRGAPGAILIYY